VPSISLTREQVIVCAAVALALLLLAARLLNHGHAATAPPIPTATAPTSRRESPRLFVDVVGAVRRPGLYRLRSGSRVADAVTRAGGVTRKARLSLVNLAAPLADGEQVVVPSRGAATSGVDAPSDGADAAAPVQLSTATAEQLDALPGIGPVTAQKILEYRQQHGAFSSVDELDAIPGIGPKRLDQLRDLVAP
jgi:competence protein ComEA